MRKIFLDKILHSKLTKNERKLNGSILLIMGFMAPSLVLILIYFLYQIAPVTPKSFFNIILFCGVTYAGLSLYGVYLYFKYKKSVVKEQNTQSEEHQ